VAGSGNLATFTWNGSLVGSLTDASSAETAAEIDVSAMGANGPRQFVQGLNTGTFTAAVLLTSASHSGIVGDALSGTERTFQFDFNDGKVSGSAVITSLSLSSALDQPVTLQISANRTTALTVVQ
jgi:hypothetical protein